MKYVFLFDLALNANLANMLLDGLDGYCMQKALHGRSIALFLFTRNKILKIQCVMHDAEDWREIGTLRFEEVIDHADSDTPKENLTYEWTEIDSVQKLVYEECDIYAESGIVIKNRLGNELIIVSGAQPCTVEILVSSSSHDFQPEHELCEYKKVEF